MIPETFNIEVYTFTSVGFVIKKRWLRFVQTELQHYFHIRYLHFVRYLDVFFKFFLFETHLSTFTISFNCFLGYCPSQETVQNGKRSSTAKAYLRPVMGRNNLHVSINSHVTKVKE